MITFDSPLWLRSMLTWLRYSASPPISFVVIYLSVMWEQSIQIPRFAGKRAPTGTGSTQRRQRLGCILSSIGSCKFQFGITQRGELENVVRGWRWGKSGGKVRPGCVRPQSLFRSPQPPSPPRAEPTTSSSSRFCRTKGKTRCWWHHSTFQDNVYL